MTPRALVLSFGETETLATKAMRGAGADWGLAEEAGRAARWLAERGHDPLPLLLGHLRDMRDWGAVRPRIAEGRHWGAPCGLLCPIALGIALCDHAALWTGPVEGGPIVTGPVNRPGLLLPFLDGLGVVAVATGVPDLFGAQHAALTIRARETASTARPRMPEGPGSVDSAVVAGLEGFALRTTVPSTEASRRSAGGDGQDE